MSDSKHTPGPWRLREDPKGWKDALVVSNDQGDIAVLTRGFESDENGEGCPSWANGRLIAAAPCLLEALKHALDQRGCIGQHACPGSDCAICTEGWGVLDAAIAKAEGK